METDLRPINRVTRRVSAQHTTNRTSLDQCTGGASLGGYSTSKVLRHSDLRAWADTGSPANNNGIKIGLSPNVAQCTNSFRAKY